MKITGKSFLAILCSLFVMGLAGCKQEGPAEKTGKEIDKAAQQVGEGVKNLGNKVQNLTR